MRQLSTEIVRAHANSNHQFRGESGVSFMTSHDMKCVQAVKIYALTYGATHSIPHRLPSPETAAESGDPSAKRAENGRLYLPKCQNPRIAEVPKLKIFNL